MVNQSSKIDNVSRIEIERERKIIEGESVYIVLFIGIPQGIHRFTSIVIQQTN